MEDDNTDREAESRGNRYGVSLFPLFLLSEFDMLRKIYMFLRKSSDGVHLVFSPVRLSTILERKKHHKYGAILLLFLQGFIGFVAGEIPIKYPNKTIETSFLIVLFVVIVLLILVNTILNYWFFVEMLDGFPGFILGKRQLAIRYVVPLYNFTWIAISSAVVVACLINFHKILCKKKKFVNAGLPMFFCAMLLVLQYLWMLLVLMTSGYFVSAIMIALLFCVFFVNVCILKLVFDVVDDAVSI